MSEADVLSISYFVHEYLHNKQTILIDITDFFSLDISEGLTEIIAQRYTNSFLKAFCGNNIKYKKVKNSPIYRDVVNIMKPLLDRFKNEKLYDDIENMLYEINHNKIDKEFAKLMRNYSIGLSLYTMQELRKNLN